jgi:hypothetical protein
MLNLNLPENTTHKYSQLLLTYKKLKITLIVPLDLKITKKKKNWK